MSIPQSIKSPQNVGFQSGSAKKLKPHQTSHHSGWMPLTLNITCSVLLINIHEYFSDQVCFHLHPACDAMFHLKRSSSASPFHMKVVEDNIAFFSTTVIQSSNLPFNSIKKTVVCVSKNDWK